jgi:hypothetical protein
MAAPVEFYFFLDSGAFQSIALAAFCVPQRNAFSREKTVFLAPVVS